MIFSRLLFHICYIHFELGKHGEISLQMYGNFLISFKEKSRTVTAKLDVEDSRMRRTSISHE